MLLPFLARSEKSHPQVFEPAALTSFQIIGVTQSSLTVYAVHCGIGEKEDLLTSGQIDRALKVNSHEFRWLCSSGLLGNPH
jgi:hypothetical protein